MARPKRLYFGFIPSPRGASWLACCRRPGGRIHQPYGLEAAGKRGRPFCLGVGSTTSYMAALRGGYIPRAVMPRQVLAACQGIHGFVSHDAHPPGPTNARLADRPPSSRA